MHAHFGFGSRGEDGFGKFFRHLETGGKLDAADAARRLIVLPASADDVAAGDAFDQNRGEAFDDHGAAFDLFDFVGGDNRRGINARKLVGHAFSEFVKPELGELGENLSLVGNRHAQNAVERADAVAGDHQEFVLTDGITFADLAAVDERKAL